MNDIVYTSTIPPCTHCGHVGKKIPATHRAAMLDGVVWDMCDDCYKALADTKGIRYVDWRLAPVVKLTRVPLPEARSFDYEQNSEEVEVFGAFEGRFKTVSDAVFWAVNAARWKQVPVVMDGMVLWEKVECCHSKVSWK